MKAYRPGLLSVTALTLALIAADKPADRLILFDGQNLDGWKRLETFKAGTVSVEGGCLVIKPGGPISGVASTRADLPTTDYELSYEAKRTEGSDFFAAATFPVGASFLTFVNGGWGGGVTGLSSINGADASENESRRYVKYQDQTWYRFRIQVTAKVVRCWVDEKAILAVNHEGQQLKTRIETRPSQPLGFTTYRSAGMIRVVEIRNLTANEVDAVNNSAEP